MPVEIIIARENSRRVDDGEPHFLAVLAAITTSLIAKAEEDAPNASWRRCCCIDT
jgi:hypothetical protein